MPIINLKHPLPLCNDFFAIRNDPIEFLEGDSHIFHECDHGVPGFILKRLVADLLIVLDASDWHKKRGIDLVGFKRGEGFVLLWRDDCLFSSRIHGTQRSIISSEIVEEGRHVTEGDLFDFPRRRNNQVERELF